MTFDIAVVLIISALTVVSFVFELIRPDLLALLVALSLTLTGVLPYDEVLLGLSDPATLAVLSMFVLSDGVFKTGLLEDVSSAILNFAEGRFWVIKTALLTVVGSVSMVINNTAAVAMFIPIAVKLGDESGVSPSKILIPLSFASMFGGVCTLVGTSTNLLANSILREKGLETFGMFGFFEYGIIFFGVGLLYLLFFAEKLIKPRREKKELTENFSMDSFLADVKVTEGSELIGKSVQELEEDWQYGFEIISRLTHHDEDYLQEGEVLRVRLEFEDVQSIYRANGLQLVSAQPINDQEYDLSDSTLVEAVVSPQSSLVGKKMRRLTLRQKAGAKILALRHQSKVKHQALGEKRLEPGDTLLLRVPKESLETLSELGHFILLKEREVDRKKRNKKWSALGVVSLVILAAAMGLVPIHISALLGVCAFVGSRIMNLNEVYRSVDWVVVFLLAGLLTLGRAIDKSGAADLLASYLQSWTVGMTAPAIVAVFFSTTLLLTAFMTNNASVALMMPIVIAFAQNIGMSIESLALTVMFGASMSFITPVGYQTNMMIFNVGQYKFKDFFVVGAPLTLIFIVLASFVLS